MLALRLLAALVVVCVPLRVWAEQHLKDVTAAQRRYDAQQKALVA